MFLEQHNIMISEGSCDTEDWNFSFATTGINDIVKMYKNRKVILNCNYISQYYWFYGILDQINAVLDTCFRSNTIVLLFGGVSVSYKHYYHCNKDLIVIVIFWYLISIFYFCLFQTWKCTVLDMLFHSQYSNGASVSKAWVSKGTLGDDLKKGWRSVMGTASRGPLNVWVSFTSAPAFDSLSSASLLKSLFDYYPPNSTAAAPNVSKRSWRMSLRGNQIMKNRNIMNSKHLSIYTCHHKHFVIQ